MKILLIVCDGLGDRPLKNLNNLTPLQYAKKPNFDRFAKEGTCGLMDTIAPGIRPGSDTSHLAILGYEPYEVYTGRGPFEAAGVGLDVKKGDIAFRCNFATVDSNFKVINRRAGRIKEGTDKLASALNGLKIQAVDILFKEAIEHRAVLVLRGERLSPKVEDIDPHKEGVKIVQAKGLDQKARFTAEVLNAFVKKSYQILSSHPINLTRIKGGKPPANIVLPRGAGIVPHISSLEENYGLKTACVVGISLIKGICRIAGMEVIEVKGATGGTDTNMLEKAKAVLKGLENYDFVLLNIKAPDVYGHDGDALGKVKSIEQLDEMLGLIMKNLSEDIIVALTSDHSTPVSVKDHSADPCPIAIKGSGVRVDTVAKFDEISVASGGLGRIKGKDLMNILLDLANRSKKFGA